MVKVGYTRSELTISDGGILNHKIRAPRGKCLEMVDCHLRRSSTINEDRMQVDVFLNIEGGAAQDTHLKLATGYAADPTHNPDYVSWNGQINIDRDNLISVNFVGFNRTQHDQHVVMSIYWRDV